MSKRHPKKTTRESIVGAPFRGLNHGRLIGLWYRLVLDEKNIYPRLINKG